MFSSDWWKANGDRIIAFLVSLVMAGVVGYFSGTAAIRSELSDAKQRIVALETHLALVEPKMTAVEELKVSAVALKNDLEQLSRLQQISSESNRLLEFRLEKQREDTLGALEVILERLGIPAKQARGLTKGD